MHVMRVHNHGTFKCELPVPAPFPPLHDYEVFSHGQQPQVESLHLSLSLLTMQDLEVGQFNEKFSCPLSHWWRDTTDFSANLSLIQREGVRVVSFLFLLSRIFQFSESLPRGEGGTHLHYLEDSSRRSDWTIYQAFWKIILSKEDTQLFFRAQLKALTNFNPKNKNKKQSKQK